MSNPNEQPYILYSLGDFYKRAGSHTVEYNLAHTAIKNSLADEGRVADAHELTKDFLTAIFHEAAKDVFAQRASQENGIISKIKRAAEAFKGVIPLSPEQKAEDFMRDQTRRDGPKRQFYASAPGDRDIYDAALQKLYSSPTAINYRARVFVKKFAGILQAAA